MTASTFTTRTLLVVGLAAMLIGVIDPLEGSFAVLLGMGLSSLAAMLGRSRFRGLIYSSFGLVAVGVAVMVCLSLLGGIGGNAGRSMWWGLLIAPYPIGWVAGLVGAVAALFEDKTVSTASGSSR